MRGEVPPTVTLPALGSIQSPVRMLVAFLSAQACASFGSEALFVRFLPWGSGARPVRF